MRLVTSSIVFMQAINSRKKLFQRQIPTVLGMIILVIALGAGVLFMGDGLGVFAPRATPQTTPKNSKVTNVTDTGFTVSFLTDETTAGFIKYGTEEGSLKSQASDDRDQLSGSVGEYSLHHITVRGLQAATKYYYVMGTGSNAEFDKEGQPFEISTARRAGSPVAAKTIYGNVLNQTNGPAEGSVVYIVVDGVGEMSSLVKSSGSWAIPLSNARTSDGSAYATITDSTTLAIGVQGPQPGDQSQVATTVAQSQPVQEITLGQSGAAIAEVANPTIAPITVPTSSPTPIPISSASPAASSSPSPTTPTVGGSLSSLNSSGSASAQLNSTTASTASAIVDTAKTGAPAITSTQPTIIGKAAPNVVVTIKVNSETQIVQQLTADTNGNFVFDISTQSKELEPGEHSVEYSYTDPNTQQLVTKKKNFTVLAQANRVGGSTTGSTTASGSASATGGPFGSGNPFPIPTLSPAPVSTSSATISAVSTRSAQIATTSALPRSGSVSTTMALLLGGGFFMIAGVWSFWISRQLKDVELSE